jgi:hypothetical protein
MGILMAKYPIATVSTLLTGTAHPFGIGSRRQIFMKIQQGYTG